MALVQIENLEVENKHQDLSLVKKIGLACFALGILFLIINLTGVGRDLPVTALLLSVGLSVFGALIYILAQGKESLPGIKNDNIMFNSFTSRGIWGWMIGVAITGFYVVLYWYPNMLENWIRMTDPLANLIYGKPADQWFLYGTFYTLAILVMGIRMLVYKYRHNRYHQVRTLSVMFFQLGLAYLIPNILKSLNQPEFYFSYFWPLKIEYLFPNTIDSLASHPGGLGIFMVFWGAVISFIGTPILTYFFGKRWYCSWVCGCGGLANTLGDPFRQLSDKSLKAWKLERWMIYSVLIFAVLTTMLLWINSSTNGHIFGSLSQSFSQVYGFTIGALFAGVIGVGFYPILGTRVWCRFGCPMAAILGILQKYLSRFRITTNGSQCISCGNCSTYCEMGIDVRWYAQREQNIIRASCVGCGVCAAVCPRGVLSLENGPVEGRYNLIED
jgi:Pyruvate/2-oxoacid:ferredoxin oxidoreductase delta subunit